MAKMLGRLAPGVSVLVMLTVAPAGAQSASECSCVAPPGTVATIVAAQGQVLVSQTAGFVPAAAGSQFSGGSVMVGPQSSAVLSLGGCSVSLLPNSGATLSMRNGSLCLSTDEAQSNGPQDQAADGFTIGPDDYVFLGGMGALTGVFIAEIFDESEPVSQ
jgi:hypothetical protein